MEQKNFSINTAVNNDLSINICESPSIARRTQTVVPSASQMPEQPSIYGDIPQIPTQDAIEGIKFDFNHGIRILFPHNGKEYHVTFTDIDTGIILYSADTVPGAYVTQRQKILHQIPVDHSRKGWQGTDFYARLRCDWQRGDDPVAGRNHRRQHRLVQLC